jgi:hypothetical protein
MTRRMTVVAVTTALAACGGGWAAFASGEGSRGDSDPGGRSAAKCPSGVTDLGPDAVARATDAVLKDAAHVFRAKKRRGMRVVTAAIAGTDNPGSYARVTCGRRVFDRTVVVTAEFPAELPSASLSSSTVLVSSTRGTYTVWQIVH